MGKKNIKWIRKNALVSTDKNKCFSLARFSSDRLFLRKKENTLVWTNKNKFSDHSNKDHPEVTASDPKVAALATKFASKKT